MMWSPAGYSVSKDPDEEVKKNEITKHPMQAKIGTTLSQGQKIVVLPPLHSQWWNWAFFRPPWKPQLPVASWRQYGMNKSCLDVLVSPRTGAHTTKQGPRQGFWHKIAPLLCKHKACLELGSSLQSKPSDTASVQVLWTESGQISAGRSLSVNEFSMLAGYLLCICQTF